jgi:alpha-beta hydrolase superfamily lysophospholipase
VPPEGSRRFVAAGGQPDRRLIEYPDGYHALLADVNGAAVLQDVTDWILARA